MTEKNKPASLKEYLWKFIIGFQLILSLTLGIFVIVLLYYSIKYLDISTYTEEQILEARKIGNWEFPDDNYVLKNFETILIDNKNIGEATVKDKKSGNIALIFDISFSHDEILKIKDNIQSQLLEKYGLGNYYLKSSGNKTGKIGEEFVYSKVGWGSGSGAQTGIIGFLDCLKNQKNGSNIIAVVYNSFVKYSEERALGFINTLNCPISAVNGGGDSNIGDKMDTDNDGLPDQVEKMLGTDPFNKDTDGDRYNDFEEIQSGYSPLIPRPWDKYTAEEFTKVKEDIKYISLDTYNRLWGGN